MQEAIGGASVDGWVWLGLEANLDGVKGVLDRFAYDPSDLCGRCQRTTKGRACSSNDRSTYRAKGDVLESLDTLVFCKTLSNIIIWISQGRYLVLIFECAGHILSPSLYPPRGLKRIKWPSLRKNRGIRDGYKAIHCYSTVVYPFKCISDVTLAMIVG